MNIKGGNPEIFDTERIREASAMLSALNRETDEGAGEVFGRINALAQSWSGTTAENAVNAGASIEKAFRSERYAALDGYVKFLDKCVADGFVRTEKSAASLYDKF